MKLINSLPLLVLSEAISHVAAFPTSAENVDINAPVPLSAFKRNSGDVGSTTEIGGHNIPLDYLATVMKDALAGGIPSERANTKRSTFDPKKQLIDGQFPQYR